MKILGLISGTSHDGIDVAQVVFRAEGDGVTATILHHDSIPYDKDLRNRLVHALPPASTTLEEITQLDTHIGQAFAQAARTAIADSGEADLIVSHGQTVFHWLNGTHVRGTLQLGQAAWIAEATGTPVLSDVRIRDVTAGGQGAPLASTLDQLLLAGRAAPGRPVAALNLGGISNVTVVDGSSPRAWDVGPANALIDAVVQDQQLHPSGYDESGSIAAAGTVDAELLTMFMEEPYYRLPAPKSTGKELFHLDYVHTIVAGRGREVDARDLVATLTELTVRTVADALRPFSVTELFASGGGVHNAVLMGGLRRALPGVRVERIDDLGVGADEKEAVLMALIGWLSWHGLPGTIPSATGATGGRVLGSFTPGSSALLLPAPRPAPAFLRISSREENPPEYD